MAGFARPPQQRVRRYGSSFISVARAAAIWDMLRDLVFLAPQRCEICFSGVGAFARAAVERPLSTTAAWEVLWQKFRVDRAGHRDL